MPLIRAVLVLVLVASSADVSLADKAKKTPEEKFAKADKNGDKKLSLEEFLGRRADDEAKKAKGTARFNKLDKNGDKSLTLEEFKAGEKKKK